MKRAASVDEGHKVLDPISRTYGQLNLADANEAETRLKVINDVIFNVLGWNRDDVTVEERVAEDGRVTYVDYIIRTAATAIVIEAKRAGTTFSLPQRNLRLQLGGVLSEGEIGAAIRQARDYCRSTAIPFAVVTNGNSWIIYPAVRTDQVSFEDSEARVFRDLDDIRTRFVDFWELLSRERVFDGNLEQELLGRTDRGNALASSVRQTLQEPGYRLGRNAVYEHIEPAVNQALSDEALLNNEQALEACYVKTSERLKFDTRLKMHLRDPMPTLGHETTRLRSRKNVTRVQERINTAQVSGVPRFIVILGPVGAGKTTFLHFTRKISAADAINDKIVWLLIDFKKATAEDPPRAFIYRQLLSAIDEDASFNLGEWREHVQPAYRDSINALRRGPLYLLSKNDPKAFELRVADFIGSERQATEPYVDKVLAHAANKWPGFLIIDNVDQLEDIDLQERVFVEAQAIARRINFSVIMSMRESTYLHHRDRPVFDAFQFDSFYIDPPSVLPVLSHRFGFAKRVLAGQAVSLTTERGMTVQVPDLSHFFDLVSRSVLDEDAGLMIDSLSGGNIRRGISLVREFLASGHTNADHALVAYLADGKYRFGPHEIFRGAVLGSSKYFNDSVSLVPNLFDAKRAAFGLQLLRLKLTNAVVLSAIEGPSEGVEIQHWISELSKIGLIERDLLTVIDDLTRRGLFRTSDGLHVRSDSTVYPTRLSAFALRQLAREFAYADMCSIDTEIFDGESFSKLKELTAEIELTRNVVERVKLRKERLDVFFEYLSRSEERWIVECKRRDLAPVWVSTLIQTDIWPAVRDDGSAAVKSAERLDEAESYLHPETHTGTIVTSKPDKDYVFIRDDEGVQWYAHRNDFLTADDWSRRGATKRCAFLRGTWQGKPRATAVRIRSRK